MSALPANFLAAVSHEMRSPLHSISGLADELLADHLNDEHRRLVAAIQRSAHVLGVLVDDVVAFGKSESGQLELHEDPFSPGQLCARVVDAFRLDAEDRGLTILADIGAGLPRSLRGDETRIRQVLTNLVSNALKYTPAGSVVLRARGAGGGVAFSVTDTGVGIPPAALDTLFVPFVQAHGATSSATGTGLGLAISQRLVALMGGDLVVQSEEGVGSTFSFELKLAENDGEEPAGLEGVSPTAAGATRTRRGGRILVVDDGPTNQLLATTQLHRLGFASAVASSGEEALDILSAETFDAVLMDWHMPGIDGLETTRRFRAIEQATPQDRLPIIAVTASAMPGDRELCLGAGMDAYLAKPVSAGDLEFVLRRWCPGVASVAAASPVSPFASAETGAGALMDVQVLAALADQVGDASVFGALVETFASELSLHCAVIASGDVREATRAAHTVKSTARTFGANPLADAAAEFERTGRAAGVIGGTERKQLCAAIDRTREALTQATNPFVPVISTPGPSEREVQT